MSIRLSAPSTGGSGPPAMAMPYGTLRVSEITATPPARKGPSPRATIDPSLLAPQGPSASPPAPRPPAPPSLAPPPPVHVTGVGVSAPVFAAYLQQLVILAGELTSLAAAGCDPDRIRHARQRLVQWIEDLRSVGGQRDLAVAVDDLVTRLSDALAASTTLAADVEAIAVELAALGSGKAPPPRPPGSRPAFWK